MGLNREFINENPYLISKCAVVAFHSGEAAAFSQYLDMLYKKLPEISGTHPDLVETAAFIGGLDFRMPMKQCVKQAAAMMPLTSFASRDNAQTSTITQNLPFFHRSMRDFSEYYELKEGDLKEFRDAYGVMIGREFPIMEQALIAGIYYERGALLHAVRYAAPGYMSCDHGEMHPETIFLSGMILSATLYAMGASQEAGGIMERMEDYIERKAQFLRPNFRALQTERAIRDGNADAAKEWLAVYASRSSRLPLYQMCRHFATLRSYMALKEYAAAVKFGARLQTLATEYKRPLDQIESGLLTALALWHNSEKNNALKQLKRALHAAMPYGFTQLFINEGEEALPLLLELKKSADKPAGWMRFADRLADSIYKKHDLHPAGETMPRLSEQQRAMLLYLSKGMSYNEIAEAAGLGRGTVKSHVLLVYKRLGVRNAREAVVKAKMLGLLE